MLPDDVIERWTIIAKCSMRKGQERSKDKKCKDGCEEASVSDIDGIWNFSFGSKL